MQELLSDAAKAGNLPEFLCFEDEYVSPALVPNFASIRFRDRLSMLALVAPLLCGTGGGRYVEYCQSMPRLAQAPF
jgi:hypothetical protein